MEDGDIIYAPKETIRSAFRASGQSPTNQEHITVLQFDATIDVGGTFYVQDGWRQKHEELLQALQERFHAVFRNNGNSFESCFQFQ